MNIFNTLLVIFIVLKCLGLITWSWWVAFSPLWILIALVVILNLCDIAKYN